MTARLRAALVGVAIVHLCLLFAWGSPTPIYDEAGYVTAGEEVARWIRCTARTAEACDGASARSLGRLAWHNPGYSALFPVAALLPGGTAFWIRLLQVLAGLIAGAATFTLLRRWTAEPVALAAAAVVWLHPVQLFFRLTLWPVALATALAAVTAVSVARLAERPSSDRRQRQLGLVLVGLVLVWPMALAVVPFLGVWLLRLGVARRVLIPLAVVWLPLALCASLVLERPTAMDLAAPENTALGNNPWITPGRGSALHDRPAVQRLRFEADRGCPQEAGLPQLRCRAARYDAIAAETVRQDPGAAIVRAGLRLVETWRPDDFVGRHLADERLDGHVSAAARSFVVTLVALAEILTLLAVLLALVGAARDRRAALLIGAAALVTSPALLSVGLTRLRQPALPWIVAAIVLVMLGSKRAYTPRR